LRLAEDGLSQREIARRTGIPLPTVARWANGRPPRFDRPEAKTCPGCGHAEHSALDAAAYAYVLGLYLGDGHLARFPRIHCLRIYLDARYRGIIAACVDAIGRLVPHNRVAVHRRPGSVVVQCYSRQWICLLPQHGPGPKHTRPIELLAWQRAITHVRARELVRGFLHSDGCRSTTTVVRRGRQYRYPRYLFSNRSADIKAIFCEHLDLLGITWRPMNAQNISVARREAVAALDAFVGPKS
jgi:transcriptional regulator with XRE-family HTH domain